MSYLRYDGTDTKRYRYLQVDGVNDNYIPIRALTTESNVERLVAVSLQDEKWLNVDEGVVIGQGK